jgi:hypothetical protein
MEQEPFGAPDHSVDLRASPTSFGCLRQQPKGKATYGAFRQHAFLARNEFLNRIS